MSDENGSVTVEGEMVQDMVVADRNELALVDVQIATAKRYPRSVERFKAEARTLATRDQETASSMFYSLKRDRKNIEGPSVRLAEIVASCWTNLHVVARQLDVHKGDRVARSQSVCWDMERNVRVGVEVSRRITRADGTVYGDDMIGVTQAAALSIAFRNSIWKVVPLAYVKDILDECKEVSIGKGLTMENRKEGAVKAFAALKVSEKDVLSYLEKKGWEDVTIEDFITLRGLLTAIKDGEITAKEAFAREDRSTTLDAVLAGAVKAEDKRDRQPGHGPTQRTEGGVTIDTGVVPQAEKRISEEVAEATAGGRRRAADDARKQDVPPEDQDVSDLFTKR